MFSEPCLGAGTRGVGTQPYRGATGWLLGDAWDLGPAVQRADGWPRLRATFESYPSVKSQLNSELGGEKRGEGEKKKVDLMLCVLTVIHTHTQQRNTGNLKVIDMVIILIEVMVSWVYASVQTQ